MIAYVQTVSPLTVLEVGASEPVPALLLVNGYTPTAGAKVRIEHEGSRPIVMGGLA